MANTSALSKVIEPFVRNWLKQEYGKEFESHDVILTLTTGGKHKFDAVSVDRSIVVEIKSSSARINTSSSRKIGAGPVRSAVVDLYFLNMVISEKKILVLTDRDFFDYFMKRMRGKIISGIEVLYCGLPQFIKREIRVTQLNAQREIGKKIVEV